MGRRKKGIKQWSIGCWFLLVYPWFTTKPRTTSSTTSVTFTTSSTSITSVTVTSTSKTDTSTSRTWPLGGIGSRFWCLSWHLNCCNSFSVLMVHFCFFSPLVIYKIVHLVHFHWLTVSFSPFWSPQKNSQPFPIFRTGTTLTVTSTSATDTTSTATTATSSVTSTTTASGTSTSVTSSSKLGVKFIQRSWVDK